MFENWFKKLEKILDIHVDLRGLITINVINTGVSKEKFKFSKDGKILEINEANLNTEEKGQVKEFLKYGFKEENSIDSFLESKSYESIEDIKEKLETNKKIITFYKDKISQSHLEALKASLYVRESFRAHANRDYIIKMKMDIISRFGDEGNNICNLCTSGYFEGFLKEVYEDMSKKPDFNLKEFTEYFENVVKYTPFTVFVSYGMSEKEIMEQIKERMEYFKNYGANFLAVHGIGEDNVEKIMKIIETLKREMKNINLEIIKKKSMIQVKIIL